MLHSGILFKSRTGIFAIAAAIALAFLFCGTAAPAQAATPAKATVYASAQQGNAFTVVPQKVTVRGNEAEKFGYTDGVKSAKGVTQLDVIVKMHELKYGKKFTKKTAGNYLQVSEGYITMAFGLTTYNWGIAENAQCAVDENSQYQSWGYTGLSVSQATVAKNDSVTVFLYQDANAWSDNLTYFAQGGKFSVSATGYTGKKISLSVKHLSNFMSNGTKNAKDRAAATSAVANATLAKVGKNGKLKAIKGATTNAKGVAKVSFKKPGTYLVSAKPVTGAYATSPYVFVKVSASKGYTVKKAGATYTVSNAKKHYVTFKKAPKKATVKVPAKIKINGTSYKVTKIASKAFKGNKKITKVVIGKNVAKIGKKAFSHTPKLKTAVVGTKHLAKAKSVKGSFATSNLKHALTVKHTVAKKYVVKSFTKKNLKTPVAVKIA